MKPIVKNIPKQKANRPKRAIIPAKRIAIISVNGCLTVSLELFDIAVTVDWFSNIIKGTDNTNRKAIKSWISVAKNVKFK